MPISGEQVAVLPRDDFLIDFEAVGRVPEALALRYDVLALSSDSNELAIAIPDPEDREAIENVANGQTIVLGGLLRDVSSQTITQVPGLSSIPVLGKFFQNKATTHERDEIVFLITPHVIFPGQTPPDR